jgi:hypothetical protein
VVSAEADEDEEGLKQHQRSSGRRRLPAGGSSEDEGASDDDGEARDRHPVLGSQVVELARAGRKKLVSCSFHLSLCCEQTMCFHDAASAPGYILVYMSQAHHAW